MYCFSVTGNPLKLIQQTRKPTVFFLCHGENYVSLYIYAEGSVLFVGIFDSLLRDGDDSYPGVFMSLRQDKMDGNSI